MAASHRLVLLEVMDPRPAGEHTHNVRTAVAGAGRDEVLQLAQFTRQHRLDADTHVGANNVVTGYDPAARRLVIVALNSGAAQTLTFDLSRFSQVAGGAGGVVPRWSTVPAGTDRYTARQDMRVIDKRVSVPFAAASVQTLQVDG